MPGRVHRPNKTPIAHKFASLPSSPSRPSPPPSPRFRFRNVLIPNRSSREGLLGPGAVSGIDLPSSGIVSGTGVAVKIGEGAEARQDHRTDREALKGTINDPARREDYFGNTATVGGVGAPVVTWGHGDDQVASTSDPDTLGRRAEKVSRMFRGLMGGGGGSGGYDEMKEPMRTDRPMREEQVAISPRTGPGRLRLAEPASQEMNDAEAVHEDSLDGFELERRIRDLLRRGSEIFRSEPGTSPTTPRRGSMNVKALGAMISRRNSSLNSSSFTHSSDYAPSPIVPVAQKPLPVLIDAAKGKEKAKRIASGVDDEDKAYENPLDLDRDQVVSDARYREVYAPALPPTLPSTPRHDPGELEARLQAEEDRLEKRLAELKREKKKIPIAVGVSEPTPLKRDKTPPKPSKGVKEDSRGFEATPVLRIDTLAKNPPINQDHECSKPILIHPNREKQQLSDGPVMISDASRDGGKETSTAFDDALHAAKGCLTMLQYNRQRKTPEKYAALAERTLSKQVKWLEVNSDNLQGKPLQSLDTLHEMFSRGEKIANDPSFSGSSSRPKKLYTLVAEGTPYMTLLALFEGTVYAAEMISSDLANELEDVYQDLAQNRAGAQEFDEAAKQVKEILGTVPKADLADGQARQAWKEISNIRVLIKEKVADLAVGLQPVKESKTEKLKSILKPKKEDRAIDAVIPPVKATSSEPSTTKVPATTAKETVNPTPGSTYEKKIEEKKPLAKGVKDSYTAFKDGGPGLPIPSDEPPPEEPKLYNCNGQVVTRSAMSLLEKEDALIRKGGLFERDGVIMTASALSLIQAQEIMERADTSGQGEWGPDTWDPIRGQYIPKWAKKLTTADRFPLVDDEGHRLRDEKGDIEQDWFDPNLDALEAKNLLQFGMDGVVDYPY